MKKLGFEQHRADASLFRLVEGGNVLISIVDNIFTVAHEENCGRFCGDWSRMST